MATTADLWLPSSHHRRPDRLHPRDTPEILALSSPSPAPQGPSPAPVLSFVAPLYNEETNVTPFVRAVRAAAAPLGIAYEILLVDDGSRDGTWRSIQAACSEHPEVKGLSLSRNFGHQGALFAGLCHARGQAVISMDGDLQHPPEVAVELYQAWREGYHVVSTQRTDSADTSAFKRVTSRGFYRVFSKLSGVQMDPGSSDFRLLDRKALDALTRMDDADLFLRGLVNWLGFRTKTIPYRAAERHSGAPKINLKRMLRFAFGALLSFSALPLRLGIWIGFLTSALAFAEICYIVVQYFRGHTVQGWASVMTVMSFMFGILFILIGIVGTYLGKIYEVLKRRPRFVVGETVGFGTTPETEAR